MKILVTGYTVNNKLEVTDMGGIYIDNSTMKEGDEFSVRRMLPGGGSVTYMFRCTVDETYHPVSGKLKGHSLDEVLNVAKLALNVVQEVHDGFCS